MTLADVFADALAPLPNRPQVDDRTPYRLCGRPIPHSMHMANGGLCDRCVEGAAEPHCRGE